MQVCVSCIFSLLAAENVLNLFRKQFLKDVDASVVIGELKQSGIVPQSCQEKISKADGYRQRNEILHDCLKRTCTRDALMMACDIIIELAGGEEDGEGGNPNMKKVGEAMKMKLETGKHFVYLLKPMRELLHGLPSVQCWVMLGLWSLLVYTCPRP